MMAIVPLAPVVVTVLVNDKAPVVVRLIGPAMAKELFALTLAALPIVRAAMGVVDPIVERLIVPAALKINEKLLLTGEDNVILPVTAPVLSVVEPIRLMGEAKLIL